jgi:5'-phosphate synthase pdxT subunit
MIGVLSLQGGVIEHMGHLGQLGVPARRVRAPADLQGLAGLIMPGGESTCLRRLLVQSGMDRAIRDAYADGLTIWGTCAGAILLARQVDGESPCLGLIDITIRRNAFGSQLDSFNATAPVPAVGSESVPLVFIRAPQITAVGPGVQVILRVRDTIAAAETDRILVTVFHPELTSCLAFHRYFAKRCGLSPNESASAADSSEEPVGAATWPRTVRLIDECATTVGGRLPG